MKKGVLIGILVLTLVALLTMGSWAWLTGTADPVSNLFAAGTVKIEVNEHGFKNITGWTRGTETTKEISVKSEGTKRSYVRVALTPVWGALDGGNFVADPNLPVDNVTLNLNQGDWVYKDGWYYYKHILDAGEETELLLSSVTLSSSTGKEYRGKVLHIVVDAEAVQASHEAYKKAWGLDGLPDGVEQWSF